MNCLELELALDWRSPYAHHRDRHRFAGVDLARASLGDHLPLLPLAGLAPGETLRLVDRLLLAERDRGLLRETTRQGWRHAPPRRGRHYPRGLLNEFPRRDLQPFRVVEVRDNCLLADFNTPWHGIEAAVDGTPIGTADAIGATAAPDDLVASVASGGPGMQATLTSADTDFFAGAPFARADETDDSRFYDRERLVDHLDAPTRAEIAALYRRLLRPGMVVLDLMASWNSHLPDDLDIAVTGLGMNATELGHNPRLRERLVHDLNRSAPLPWPEPAFDAALCALSIEYLVHPLAVVRELARVLKPGAPFVVTFSDRWFPPKAIALWSELHPFERLALVVDYLRLSGGFDNIQTESLRGLPAPTGVWRPPGRRHADPLFAVWGYRVSRR